MGPSPIELISGGKYLTLTPAQLFKVGKKAAEHSITYYYYFYYQIYQLGTGRRTQKAQACTRYLPTAKET